MIIPIFFTNNITKVYSPREITPIFNHDLVKIGRISSPYGYRIHPITKKRKFHAGMDIAAPKGTPIKVTGDGAVKFVGYNGGYGKTIKINHGKGIETRYAHMSKFKKGLIKGKPVKKGDIIGYVGTTGRSTGNHLHYEYRVYGKIANPFAKNNNFAGRIKTGKTLKTILMKAESARRGYNDYNRGSDKCSYNNRQFINFSKMSIRVVKIKQSFEPCTKHRLHAVGWPQVIGTTLKQCQRSMGFSNRAKYNKYLQDKIFVECLTKSKRPTIYRYVVTGKGLKFAARAVAREWASIGSPIHCNIKRYNKKGKVIGVRPWSKNGGCYNSGYGINHHSVHPREILKALQLARYNYKILRERGVNNIKAYAYSIGVEKY